MNNWFHIYPQLVPIVPTWTFHFIYYQTFQTFIQTFKQNTIDKFVSKHILFAWKQQVLLVVYRTYI